MGCQCAKSEVDAYIHIDSLITTPSNANPNSNMKLTDYVKIMFKLINKARRYPKDFADIIEKSIIVILNKVTIIFFGGIKYEQIRYFYELLGKKLGCRSRKIH